MNIDQEFVSDSEPENSDKDCLFSNKLIDNLTSDSSDESGNDDKLKPLKFKAAMKASNNMGHFLSKPKSQVKEKILSQEIEIAKINEDKEKTPENAKKAKMSNDSSEKSDNDDRPLKFKAAKKNTSNNMGHFLSKPKSQVKKKIEKERTPENAKKAKITIASSEESDNDDSAMKSSNNMGHFLSTQKSQVKEKILSQEMEIVKIDEEKVKTPEIAKKAKMTIYDSSDEEDNEDKPLKFKAFMKSSNKGQLGHFIITPKSQEKENMKLSQEKILSQEMEIVKILEEKEKTPENAKKAKMTSDNSDESDHDDKPLKFKAYMKSNNTGHFLSTPKSQEKENMKLSQEKILSQKIEIVKMEKEKVKTPENVKKAKTTILSDSSDESDIDKLLKFKAAMRASNMGHFISTPKSQEKENIKLSQEKILSQEIEIVKMEKEKEKTPENVKKAKTSKGDDDDESSPDIIFIKTINKDTGKELDQKALKRKLSLKLFDKNKKGNTNRFILEGIIKPKIYRNPVIPQVPILPQIRSFVFAPGTFGQKMIIPQQKNIAKVQAQKDTRTASQGNENDDDDEIIILD